MLLNFWNGIFTVLGSEWDTPEFENLREVLPIILIISESMDKQEALLDVADITLFEFLWQQITLYWKKG